MSSSPMIPFLAHFSKEMPLSWIRCWNRLGRRSYQTWYSQKTSWKFGTWCVFENVELHKEKAILFQTKQLQNFFANWKFSYEPGFFLFSVSWTSGKKRVMLFRLDKKMQNENFDVKCCKRSSVFFSWWHPKSVTLKKFQIREVTS